MNVIERVQNKDGISTLICELDAGASREEHLAKVYQIFEIYGLGHGCLQTAKDSNFSTNALWRSTPEEVTSACNNLTNKNKHPAVKLSQSRFFPFDLFDYRENFKEDADISALYSALENNGLTHAYGLPVHTRNNELFVFVAGRPQDSLIEMSELLTLQTICVNAVNHMLLLEKPLDDDKKANKLRDDEIGLLISIAQGANRYEISKELGVSEVYIDLMLKAIKEKLGAQNVSHSIVIALIEGEFALSDCSISKN